MVYFLIIYCHLGSLCIYTRVAPRQQFELENNDVIKRESISHDKDRPKLLSFLLELFQTSVQIRNCELLINFYIIILVLLAERGRPHL